MLCPICKRPLNESTSTDASRFFPFCSERCKLIDLGRWLDERYQIPVNTSEAPLNASEAPSESIERERAPREQ